MDSWEHWLYLLPQSNKTRVHYFAQDSDTIELLAGNDDTNTIPLSHGTWLPSSRGASSTVVQMGCVGNKGTKLRDVMVANSHVLFKENWEPLLPSLHTCRYTRVGTLTTVVGKGYFEDREYLCLEFYCTQILHAINMLERVPSVGNNCFLWTKTWMHRLNEVI